MPPEVGTLECFKLFLMVDSGQNQNVNMNTTCKDQTQGDPVRHMKCFDYCTTDHVCYPMIESLSALCSCPETAKTEIKHIRLTKLGEEISRWSNVEEVSWLLGNLRKICIKNQEDRA